MEGLGKFYNKMKVTVLLEELENDFDDIIEFDLYCGHCVLLYIKI